MKVLVVNNVAPFLRGGAEALAEEIVRRLNTTKGIEAELLRIPFKWEPAERLIEEILICRSMRLYNTDLMIGLKFPAYLVPHTRKRLWLLHQYRQAYDLWDAGQSNIPNTPRGHEIRQAVIEADNRCIPDCEKIFATRLVANRLLHYNGFDSEIMMAPLNDPELFTGGDYGSHVFCGGRINAGKRQRLLVEAMRFTRSKIKLVVAGPADTPADAARLQDSVERHKLKDRVHLDLGFLPRERIAKYVNEALACAYLPIDEDSVGYVTMEAFSAAKAMLTANDSGGLLDIVHDGDTGLVVEPDPESLAAAIDRLANSRNLTIEMGMEGRERWNEMNVTWPATIERLLA
jgi:glycosyltransferase involved in cell wall biosynthesis